MKRFLALQPRAFKEAVPRIPGYNPNLMPSPVLPAPLSQATKTVLLKLCRHCRCWIPSHQNLLEWYAKVPEKDKIPRNLVVVICTKMDYQSTEMVGILPVFLWVCRTFKLDCVCRCCNDEQSDENQPERKEPRKILKGKFREAELLLARKYTKTKFAIDKFSKKKGGKVLVRLLW